MPVQSLANLIYMDGLDLFTNFGLAVKSGMAGFLAYAPKKDGISHDWMDSDGTEYDLSRIFLKERVISLQCGMFAVSEADWISKHDAFISFLRQPGFRRLEYTPFPMKQYFVFYMENTNYRYVKGLNVTPGTRTVWYEFTLTLKEPVPNTETSTQEYLYADVAFIVK